MNKYTVSIWDEGTSSFRERTYKTSARALHHFFSFCLTEPYSFYEVVYAERLSSGKYFTLTNVIPTPDIPDTEFIVCPKLLTEVHNIRSSTFLPLLPIRDLRNQCVIKSWTRGPINSDAKVKGNK
jgi:hypothetical protein